MSRQKPSASDANVSIRLALTSVTSLLAYINDLTLEEIERAYLLEAGSRRRKAVLRRLEQRYGVLAGKRAVEELQCSVDRASS